MLKWIFRGTAAAAFLWAGAALASASVPQTPLPGNSIPKYVDPVPTFVGARVAKRHFSVEMKEFQQEVLPASEYAGLPAPFSAGTFVWGYKVDDRPASYPGFTVEARRGIPTTVRYVNEIVGPGGTAPFLQEYLTVDQTLHWADPLGLNCIMNPTQPACFQPYAGPVPTAVHLHGAEVPSAFDGGPEQWFTPNGLHGKGYASLFPVADNAAAYRYPNEQEATTLFFHDHALGVTRINVYSGLAAFYFIRDDHDTGELDNPLRLPAGDQEIELALQDRMFDTNRQWLFPDNADNPSVHPFWLPEFFGDVIVVNGKSWPFLEVEPRRYRLRFVDGSNARFYNMALMDQNGNPGPTIWQIGTDGGPLDHPVPITPPARMLMAPGERADVIADFSEVPFGTTLTLTNDANAPFPDGNPVDPDTTAQIMQFRVVKKLSSKDRACHPDPRAPRSCRLRHGDPIVRLVNPETGTLPREVEVSVKRQLVLKEIEGANGPLEVLLNNTKWMGVKESTMTTTREPIPDSKEVLGNFLTELPQIGATEEWEIINITPDAHPIHLHLVQFQLLNRQSFNAATYTTAWEAAFPGGVLAPGDGPPRPYLTVNDDGAIGGNIAVSPYLIPGSLTPPEPREAGWKDTVVMRPNQVTRIIVRFAPQDVSIRDAEPGTNLYPFDPTLVIGGNPLCEHHCKGHKHGDDRDNDSDNGQGEHCRCDKDDSHDEFGNPPGPGYVWHCHIIDHEDNEMMRPYVPVCEPQTSAPPHR